MRDALARVHARLLPPEACLGWAPYIWILYTGFLFFPFIFGDSPRSELLATIATVFVFLPLYFLGFRWKGRRGAAVVLALIALGMVTATFNSGASVYFIYAASFAGFLGPPRVALRYLGIIILAAALETLLLDLSRVFLLITVIVSVMVGGSNIYWRQMDIKGRQLRASQDEVRRLATAAERERIARDLHDLLGHTLSSISLKAELARRLIDDDPATARREMAEVERIARSATAEVRQAVSGYQACTVSGEAVRGRRHLESLGIEVTTTLPADLALDPTLDNMLGLIVREALTNVARHARASACRVVVRVSGGGLELNVEDDGVGGAQLGAGTGLRSIRDRISAFDGSLTVDRSPMGGVRLAARLPLPGDAPLLAEPATP